MVILSIAKNLDPLVELQKLKTNALGILGRLFFNNELNEANELTNKLWGRTTSSRV